MSRTNARSRALRRRHSRTVPATITAVVILAAGVLAAIAAIARLSTGSWPTQVSDPAGTVAGLTWGSTAMIIATSVAVVLGLVMIISGVKPGRHTSAQLDPGSDGAVAERDYVISNRAIARLAAGRADLVDGVEKVSASASGRRVHLKINTTSEQQSEIRERVVAGVNETLAAAGVRPQPRVTAAVRTKEI